MRKSLSRLVHGRAKGNGDGLDSRLIEDSLQLFFVVQTAWWSSPDSEECDVASMIGVSARRRALSCAVCPVPPHLAWPRLVSS